MDLLLQEKECTAQKNNSKYYNNCKMIVTSSIWQKEMEKKPKPHCFLGKGGLRHLSLSSPSSNGEWEEDWTYTPLFHIVRKAFSAVNFRLQASGRHTFSPSSDQNCLLPQKSKANCVLSQTSLQIATPVVWQFCFSVGERHSTWTKEKELFSLCKELRREKSQDAVK